MLPDILGLARRAFRPGTVTMPEPVRPAPSRAFDGLMDLFDRAGRVTVLTGAGMSVASGLGTYRDDEGHDVSEKPIAYRHFLIDPAARLSQWRRSVSDARGFSAASPNAGHVALARMAATGKVRVVTQNVDGLHARAGTPEGSLVELHGNAAYAECPECRRTGLLLEHAEAAEAGTVPTCSVDGHWLQPAVTMFGMQPLRSRLARAEEWARDCDLFMVVGTSLAVTPAGYLPVDAGNAGAGVVVINPGPMRRSVKACLVVREDASAVLASLVR